MAGFSNVSCDSIFNSVIAHGFSTVLSEMQSPAKNRCVQSHVHSLEQKGEHIPFFHLFLAVRAKNSPTSSTSGINLSHRLAQAWHIVYLPTFVDAGVASGADAFQMLAAGRESHEYDRPGSGCRFWSIDYRELLSRRFAPSPPTRAETFCFASLPPGAVLLSTKEFCWLR